jgi:hypothetical protein
MPGTSLIGDYLTALSAQLPATIVEELADALEQTRLHYLEQGLEPDAAAGAALAEFGQPDVIVAAFTRLSPARRAARRPPAAGHRAGGRRVLGHSTDHQPGLDLARPGRSPDPARHRADHRHRAAHHRRVRQPVPLSQPRRNRRMRQHHRARRRDAGNSHAHRPGLDLAADPGHGRKRGPPHVHRADIAPRPDKLRLASGKTCPGQSRLRAQQVRSVRAGYLPEHGASESLDSARERT